MSAIALPRFRSSPWLEPLMDGRRWKLVHHPLVFEGSDGREIVVPEGFVTDLASIPQALQSVYPKWGVYGRATIVHDYLYSTQPCTREEADSVFLDAMLADGVDHATRMAMHAGVRAAGQFYWDQNNRDKMNSFDHKPTSQLFQNL